MESILALCEGTATMTTTRSASRDVAPRPDFVEVELTVTEHRALMKMKYVDPTQLARLKAATPVTGSRKYVCVRMERYLLEMLAGDLAYVINRSALNRSTQILNVAADAIESALRWYREPVH